MAVYAAMIDRMDQNIGRVLADLRSHGELDNTLVIFLSDNGACAEWDPNGFDGSSGPHNILHTGDDLKKLGGPESYVSYGSGWANACNTPWRLYKHYDYEGGITAPCIVRWPAAVKHPGGLNSTPSDIIDFMPTILEVSGASYPEDFQNHPILPMEGRSLLPILKDEPATNRPIFFEHEGNRAVRDGEWKLVALDNEPWELYDFDHDRSELHNRAGQHPEIVARLAEEWDLWATRCFVRRSNSPVSTNSAALTVPNPQVANKALTISCDTTPEAANGVILAQGGRQDGYALWLHDGKLLFTVRVNGTPSSIEATNIPTGHIAITARLNRDTSMELEVDGESVAKGKAPGLIPVQPKDALNIGEDDRTPVGHYASPNPLRGKVENVRVIAE